MKVKASVSLSENLIKMIDRLPGDQNRSEVIEEALILYFKNRKAIKRDQDDLEQLNSKSQALNEEADDVLGFQSF
jgi:metal-responsive CopG/Arc/MetJ family transcriptional regulator